MDTREFAERLKEHGELVEIDEEVDWNYELPAMELLSGRMNGPAFLFNNIKDTPNGEGRVLAGHFSGSFRKPHLYFSVVGYTRHHGDGRAIIHLIQNTYCFSLEHQTRGNVYGKHGFAYSPLAA